MQLTSNSFVSSELKERRSDLVYLSNIDNKLGYIYVLMEAQSTEKKWQTLYLIEYNLLLLKQHIDQHKDTTKLPCIINIVLYNGKKKYKGPTTLEDSFQDPALLHEMLRRPFLINLQEETDDEILKDKKAALVEIVLKQGKLRNFYNLLKNKKINIELINNSTYWKEVIFYILDRDKGDPKQFLKKLPNLAPEKKENIMSALQQIEQRGRTEGIQIGEQRGRTEGIQIGEQRGEQKGRTEGIQIGEKKGKEEMLQKLFNKGVLTKQKFAELLQEIDG